MPFGRRLGWGGVPVGRWAMQGLWRRWAPTAGSCQAYSIWPPRQGIWTSRRPHAGVSRQLGIRLHPSVSLPGRRRASACPARASTPPSGTGCATGWAPRPQRAEQNTPGLHAPPVGIAVGSLWLCGVAGGAGRGAAPRCRQSKNWMQGFGPSCRLAASTSPLSYAACKRCGWRSPLRRRGGASATSTCSATALSAPRPPPASVHPPPQASGTAARGLAGPSRARSTGARRSFPRKRRALPARPWRDACTAGCRLRSCPWACAALCLLRDAWGVVVQVCWYTGSGQHTAHTSKGAQGNRRTTAQRTTA